MNIVLSVLALALGMSLIAQALLLRTAHRRKLATQESKHLRVQQAMGEKAEQTRQQIAQLQSDLSAARLKIAKLSRNDAASLRSSVDARYALERELDDATAVRQLLPVDGFADTQVSAHDTRPGNLLLQ